MIYLVSYPHSGNSWVRYFVEYLTKLPTHGHKKFSISQRDNNCLNIDINADPVLIKRHELYPNEIKKDDKFILLIRNPYDCIKEGEPLSEFLKYYGLILEYEKFKGEKIVLYYDDLFLPSTLHKLVEFSNFFNFKFKIHDLRHFCYNIKEHKKKSLSLYQNKTKMPGILKNVPNIYLENDIIKRFKHR